MRSRRLAFALTAAAFLCASVAPASAAPDKTERRAVAGQVLEQRLAALGNQVPTIQQQLAASAARARAAVSKYADAMQHLGTVKTQASVQLAALAKADRALAEQRRQLEAVARQAYIAGDALNQVAIVLAGGSPTDIFDGMSLLSTMADTRTRLLDRYAAAQQRQADAAAAATAATARVEAITVGADTARRAAVVAAANRHMQLGRVTATMVKTAQRIVHDDAVAPAAAAGATAATSAASAGEPTTAPQPAPAPAPAPTDPPDATMTVGGAAPTPVVPSGAKADATAKPPVSVDALRAARRQVLAAAWASLRDLSDKTPAASAKRGLRAVAWAKKQLGVPYSWGGGDAEGPTTGVMMPHGRTIAMRTIGFDCSGLVIYAWAHAGVTFDHYTGYQWFEGRQVSLDHLRAGDLVFFANDVSDPLTIHHVGIYVGAGHMIDAPHTGAVVRYDNVQQPGLIGAVRP